MKRSSITFSILSLFLLINFYTPIRANSYDNASQGVIEVINDDGDGRELSFEEMVSEIAILQNKEEEVVREFYIGKKIAQIQSTSLDLSAAKDSTNFREMALSRLAAESYYTDTFPLSTIIGDGGWDGQQTYYARATLYYSYTGTASNRSIVSVLYAGIIGQDINNLYKSFGGDFYINVETDGKIHYIVNGSYFNTGTSTTGLSINVPVGGAATVSISASNSTNFFAGIYKTGDRYSKPR